MKLFDLSVVTPERVIYQGKAVSMVVPAGLGSMGVLADHMPLISTMSPGAIAVQPPDHEGKFIFHSLGKGFLEIAHNKVTVILEAIGH
jgi:F-type H+-transporting ATPase subunit epsilon